MSDASKRKIKSERSQDNESTRLTLRLILQNIIQYFFNVEQGWLLTIKELTICPGAMIRRYVAGERKKYANPVAYFLSGTTVTILMRIVTGFQELVIEHLTTTNPFMTPGQQAFLSNFMELVFQNTLYISFLIIIPLVILLRLFFRRSGFNLAELLVFCVYSMGHLSWASIVLIPLYYLMPGESSWIDIVINTCYIAYAAAGFFDPAKLRSIFKSILAFGLSFGIFLIVIFFSSFFYLKFFRPSYFFNSDDWNLVTATENNELNIARKLVDEGSDVNLTLRFTPLHLAVKQGNIEFIDLFLKAGANLNAQDYQGRTPLFLALEYNKPGIANKLVSKEFDASVASKDSTTLLMKAVEKSNYKVVKLLIDKGAPINAIRHKNNWATALMIASALGDTGMVELLLSQGADPKQTNEKGQTALSLASSLEIKRLLKASTKSNIQVK